MSGMQPESVIFSQGHKSRSRLIVIIQEALGEDLIRTPLKVDPPAFRGAHEWNPVRSRDARASFVPTAGIRCLTMTVLGQAQA